MSGKRKGWVALLAVWVLCGCEEKKAWKPLASAPLLHAHAHNDYEHGRPLQDALDHGFTSVEADIHLVDGHLLVAHMWWNRDRKRKLGPMYLEPLRQRVKKHKGKVYAQASRFLLLVDVKTEAKKTYLALHRLLASYKDILTSYDRGKVKPGAVTVIVSGNRSLETMSKQTLRYASYDGRPEDLDEKHPASLISMVSQKWSRMFSWGGKGPMPKAEREKLAAYVKRAHGQGRIVRFWATPDQPGPARQRLWGTLRELGVDLLNTDDLTGLQRFFLQRDPRLKAPAPRRP